MNIFAFYLKESNPFTKLNASCFSKKNYHPSHPKHPAYPDSDIDCSRKAMKKTENLLF
jgi:hypothetical protein